MRAQFIRGASSREEIIDTILGRIITLEIPTYGIELKNGDLDTTDMETKEFADELENAGVSYEINGWSEDGYAYLNLSGTKKQLISIFPLWDAYGRDPQELERDLKYWDGDQQELLDTLF
jgi:hypothetical protein